MPSCPMRQEFRKLANCSSDMLPLAGKAGRQGSRRSHACPRRLSIRIKSRQARHSVKVGVIACQLSDSALHHKRKYERIVGE